MTDLKITVRKAFGLIFVVAFAPLLALVILFAASFPDTVGWCLAFAGICFYCLLKAGRHAHQTINKALALSIEEHVQARTALLVSSNADLEAFSYTVSHDLQAPLRAIDGFAQVLCEDFNKQLPEQAYSLLARIRSNAQYMTQLINSLLDFSRLSRTALVLVDVDLNSLVENIQVQLNAKQHARFVLGDLPTVKADYILFSQVWMNLIDNALKFSSGKEDPCIEITAQRFSDQWHFVVRDNGAGFDMKYMGFVA